MSKRDDDLWQGRGQPLRSYSRREAEWPAIWRLPEPDEDGDVFDKIAWLADDHLLRQAVNIFDNALRAPGAFEGLLAGLISAHARLAVGSAGLNPDIEKAADAIRDAWLGMARQALEFQAEHDGPRQ